MCSAADRTKADFTAIRLLFLFKYYFSFLKSKNNHNRPQTTLSLRHLTTSSLNKHDSTPMGERSGENLKILKNTNHVAGAIKKGRELVIHLSDLE